MLLAMNHISSWFLQNNKEVIFKLKRTWANLLSTMFTEKLYAQVKSMLLLGHLKKLQVKLQHNEVLEIGLENKNRKL